MSLAGSAVGLVSVHRYVEKLDERLIYPYSFTLVANYRDLLSMIAVFTSGAHRVLSLRKAEN
jgi:hypothetical protein